MLENDTLMTNLTQRSESTIDSTQNNSAEEVRASDQPINTPEDNLNKLFVDLGGAGRFQYLAYAVIGMALNSTSYWAYPLGYFIQQPKYDCDFTAGVSEAESLKLCTAQYICDKDPRITNWSIDWESDKSLENWQGKLDLMCAPTWKVGMLGTCLFVGWASTLLWVPSFGDKYGRKNIFAVSMSLNLIMYSVMMWTTSLDVMLISVFFQGALNSVRVNIGYLYLLEMMPKHLQTTVGSIWGMSDAAIYLLATLYFWKVSKEWFYFAMIGYFLNVFTAIGAWFLPESPRYLLNMGKIDELKDVMQTVADVNQ